MSCSDAERSARGDQGEDGVEHRPFLAEQQDPRPDEVVEGHPQGHLLPEEDPRQPARLLLHQELVSATVPASRPATVPESSTRGRFTDSPT